MRAIELTRPQLIRRIARFGELEAIGLDAPACFEKAGFIFTAGRGG